MSKAPREFSLADLSRVLERYAGSVALVLTLLAFTPCLFLGFVYDDLPLIVQNRYYQEFEYAGRAWVTHFWDTERGYATGFRYYRPLVSLSYIVDWQLGGGAPWVFHLTNMVWHALGVLLAVRVGKRWLGDIRLVVLPVLLFALHPTRMESVAWVSGRTDLLATVCVLGAVDAAAGYRERGGLARLGFVAVLVLAGFLCKETAIVAPLLLAADRWQSQPRAGDRRSWTPLLLSTFLCTAYLVIRLGVYPVTVDAGSWSPGLALTTLGHYVQRVLLPWPQSFFLAAGQGVTQVGLLLGGLALLGGAWACWCTRRHRTVWIWFAVGALLLPVLPVFDYGLAVTVSDRFLYLGLLLLAFAGAAMLRTVGEAAWRRRWFPGALVGMAVTTVVINAVSMERFVDNAAYLRHELEVNPANPVALESRAAQQAGEGALQSAVADLRAIFAPTSQAFPRLYAAVAGRASVRLLALNARLTPDGDVAKLEQAFRRLTLLEDFARGRVTLAKLPPELRGLSPEALRRDLQVEGVSTEVLVLGARIGHAERAARSGGALPLEEVLRSPAAAHAVVAWLLLDELKRAERLLTAIAQQVPPAMSRQELRQLQRLMARARQLPLAGERRVIDQAQFMAGLGAYLRALRALHPLRAEPEAHRLYVELLVWARLEKLAQRELERSVEAGQAAAIVAQLRRQLPADLRSQSAVAAAPGWFLPP